MIESTGLGRVWFSSTSPAAIGHSGSVLNALQIGQGQSAVILRMGNGGIAITGCSRLRSSPLCRLSVRRLNLDSFRLQTTRIVDSRKDNNDLHIAMFPTDR